MKLLATINGQPAEIELPISFVPRLALKKSEAALALGVSRQTIWRLASTDKIVKTSTGTYPVKSLEAYLEREMVRKAKRAGKAKR